VNNVTLTGVNASISSSITPKSSITGSAFFNLGYVSSTNAAVLLPDTTNYSFSIWIYFTGATATNYYVFSFFTAQTNSLAIYIKSNRILFSAYPGDSDYDFSSITNNVWTHMVCTITNRKTYNFYINGQNIASTTVTTGVSSASRSNVGIGTSGFSLATEGGAGSNTYFKGYLSNFKIWNRALSAAEITSIYSLNSVTPTPYYPTQIAGITLWLDANKTSSLTLSGSNVTQWNDLARNTNLSNTSSYPTYSETGLNGKPTISFVGSLSGAQNLYNNSAPSLYNSLSSFSFFTVLKSVPSNAAWASWFSIYTNFTIYLGSASNTNPTNPWFYNGSSLNGGSGDGRSYIDNTIILVRVTVSGGSLTVQIYGSNGSYTNTFSYTVGTASSQKIYVGYSGYNFNDSFNGLISEMLFYNSALTKIQYQQVEGYLAWKWGLQTSLPATHPYNIQAPTTYSVAGPIDSLSATTKAAMLGTGKSAGAYGTRVLYSGYTGPVMNIKRSSDNAIQDFYSDASGNLGTAFLGKGTSFATWLAAAGGTPNAIVMTWYDQTGNGNHGTGVNTPIYNTSTKTVSFASGYFSIPNYAFPTGNSAYTYVFTPNNQTGASQNIFYGGSIANGLNQVIINLTGEASFFNGWYGAKITSNDTGAGFLNGTKLAVSYDGTTSTTDARKLYYNNVLRTNVLVQAGTRNQYHTPNALGQAPAGSGNNYTGTLQFFYWSPINMNLSDITILCDT